MKTMAIMRFGALLAAGAILWAQGGVAPSWATKYVTVPSVLRLYPSDACNKLQAAGLKCQVGHGQVDYINEAKPSLAGKVSRQLPAAGSRQPKGATVRLATYQQKWLSIPNLVKSNVYVAENKLRGLGLRTQRKNIETGDKTKKDVVYLTSPASGATVKPGVLVTLSVYKYITITLPDLRGLSSSDACDRLSKLGLKCDTHASDITCDPKKFFKVITHFPRPGFLAGKGSKVTVVTYRKGPTNIPHNILGMRYQDARAAIGPNKPPITVNWSTTGNPQLRGTVWKVEPIPGTATSCDRPVTLWVYK